MTPPLRIYLPFADGELGYDCARCGARCCQGLGLGATAEEHRALVERYPALRYFAVPDEAPTERYRPLANLRHRCFFLDEDARCTVHTEAGRATKPLVCKTFPVADLLRVDDILVADINDLCPVELVSQAERPVETRVHAIRHEQVCDDLRAAEAAIRARTEPHRATAAAIREGHRTAAPRLTGTVIDHETWCRDLASRRPDLDNLQLWAAHALALPHLSDSIDPPEPDADANTCAAQRDRLQSFIEQTVALLDVDALVDDLARRIAEDPRLRAVTPRLRLALIRRLPRFEVADLLAIAPRALCALGLHAQLAAAVRPGAGEPTLSGLATLLDRFLVGYVLLAFADHVPLLTHAAESSRDRLARVERLPAAQRAGAADLLRRIERRERHTLAELLQDHVEPEARLPLLCSLEPLTPYLRFTR